MARLSVEKRGILRPTTKKKRVTYSFVPLLVFALGIHLLAAVVNEGFYGPEESYRYLGLADHGPRLGTKQELPPLIRDRTTPGLLPVLGHLVISGAESLGIASPFVQSTLLRVFSSLLGILGALMMFSSFRGECTSHAARRWLFLLLLLLWFIPSLQARFSPENWSGLLFFMGLAWYYQKGEQGEASMMIAGFLLGLSFFARFQTAALLAGFLGWLVLIERADRRVLISLLGGAAIATILGILADKVFYGTWTMTAWDSLLAALGDRSSTEVGRGDNPWWFAIVQVVQRGFFPIGLLLVASTLFFVAHSRRHVLTWVLVPYLLLHLLTPSPALSELFPLVLAVPVIVVLTVQTVLEAIPAKEWRQKVGTVLTWIRHPLWAVNLALLLGASLLPADEYGPMYRFVYDRYGGGETILLHTGKDPYERPDIPMAFYAPILLKRLPIAQGTPLLSIVAEHPGARVLLATHSETLPAGASTEGIELHQVYKSVPEWSALANSWGWFQNADTLVLHEVRRDPHTPMATIPGDPATPGAHPDTTATFTEATELRAAPAPPAHPTGTRGSSD